MGFEEGPFLNVACFCESVIEGKDGVLSLIRVIDTLTHTSRGISPPEDMPQVGASFKLVVILKAGNARGRFALRIIPEKPSGIKDAAVELPVHLEGEDKGQNIVSNFQYTFDQEGLYWFHILLDEDFLTKISFRVRYIRIATSLGPVA